MNQVSIEKKDFSEKYNKIDWWDKEKIKNAKIMVVGAGALGNEVLKNLALLDFRYIFLVDFDDIEYGNLSRSILYREEDCGRLKCEVAKEKLEKINPKLKVQALNGDVTIDVGLGLIKRMDVIIGCLDNRLARLFLNRFAYKMNKTWIDGGIENLSGQLHVYKPYHSCYECGLTLKDRAKINDKLSCPTVAAFQSERGSVATTPVSASIIGAMQAQEALKVVLESDHVMLNESFRYIGTTNFINQPGYPSLKEGCQSHFTVKNIDSSRLSCNNTVQEALSYLSNKYNDPDPNIELDHEIVLEVVARESRIKNNIAIPRPYLKEDIVKNYVKIKTEPLELTEITNTLDSNFPYLDKSLKSLGVPPLHIIKVLTEENVHYVELTSDENYLDF